MSYESESKLTFGNILLGLLLLGVVVVIGLIVFVYFALTKNSSSKTNFTPNDTPPAQTIDQLSPEGKTLPSVPRAQALDGKKASAPVANPDSAQQNAADKVVKDLATDAPPNMAGRDVLANNAVAGERPKPKPKPKPKPVNPDAAANGERNNTAVAGEKPLTPTNRIAGERDLQPTNKRPTQRNESVAGERPLQPQQNINRQPAIQPARSTRNDDSGSRSRSNSSGEIPLKPTNTNSKPRNNNGGGSGTAIDDLF